MKTKLLLILVLISIKTVAQIEPCGTIGFNQLSQAKKLQLQSPQTYDPDAKHVLNVRFTMVNNQNNQNFCTINNIPFGEADYLEIIKILNINFNPFNIFFKYYGSNTINLDNSLLPQTNQDILPLSDYLTDQSEKDAINIYFLQQLRQPTQIPTPTASYQYVFGEAILGRPIILLSLPSYVGIYRLGNGSCQDYLMEKDFLVCHEMGHALGLHHVWNNWDNQITTNPYLLAEHVTREPLNPDGSVNTNYNADIAGDFVADTPVTRSELYAINYDEDDCTLKNLDSPTFPMRDIQGTLFDFENIKYDNFMSYIYKVNNINCGSNYQLSGCSDRIFTPGQGVAMRKFIQNVPYVYTNFGETGYTSTNFNFTLTYLESLYEPFFVGGGGSNSGYPSVALQKTYSTNETFTGANVWNCGPFTMRFQPGFNYEFSNTPGILFQNVETQPNIASSTYIGVKIPYLSQDIINAVAPTCFSSYEPFTSGDIKSTIQIGAIYYTLEELDKIKASDPELYEQLQSQMYHIITKQTDSGYSDQKIIHKN